MRRLLPSFLVVLACSGGATSPITPPPESTSTTVAPTTTQPFLDGAPDGWGEAVAGVYGQVCQGDRAYRPEALADFPEPSSCPRGTSAHAVIGDQTLAVAVLGDDIIYGVGEEGSFAVVAARLPSLGQERGWYGTVPKLIAVVGSDARPGEDAAHSRGDSIHLVGLDGLGSGGVLGIPRDSWVPIASGGENKINAALALGGPEAMLATLADTSELPLQGLVVTGFEGFVNIWDEALQGAEVNIPFDISDAAAKADFEAGVQTLDGTQALAFSRTRKTLSGGDLTRQYHGGVVLLAALAKAQSAGPEMLPEMLAASAPWLVTDLSWVELLSWSALALDTPVEAIGNALVPARIGSVGSASVVFLTGDAPEVFAELADGSFPPESG